MDTLKYLAFLATLLIFFPESTFASILPQIKNALTTNPQRLLHPTGFDHAHPKKSNSSFAGDSPFFYCTESDPENDLFEIDSIVLNPNPPAM